MAISVNELVRDSLLNQVSNKSWNPGRQSAQNLTGTNHTTIDRLDDNTGTVVSVHESGGVNRSTEGTKNNRARQRVEVFVPNNVNFRSARGWGDCVGISFEAEDDYAQIALAGAEDWTAGNAEDDYLVFWMWSDRAFANTEFDLELRDSSNALITGANYTVAAHAIASRWQLYTIDTSAQTLSDVQYIRLQHDVATQTEIRLCDFVRTDANCLDNAFNRDLLLASNLDGQARFLNIKLSDMTTTDIARVYINSLANGYYILYPDDEAQVHNEVINAFFINSMTSDTSVTLDVQASGRL